MKLKGKLIIIGGAEDKGEHESSQCDFVSNGILECIVRESAHKNNSRIEIITTASSVPEETGDDYLKAFKKLAATNVGVMHLRHRQDADDPKAIKRLDAADVIFFTGGDQLRLTTTLGGTFFFERILERLQTERDFIFAGTSAGAAAASESMILDGGSEKALLKGEVVTATGFGLVGNIIFDTHFIKRGRIGRLFQIVVTNPKILGIGLEEDTGLLFYNNKMEAIGPGMTILVDGREIKNNNLIEIKAGAPISIENLKLHVMSRTDVYDLQAHQLEIITPEECKI